MQQSSKFEKANTCNIPQPPILTFEKCEVNRITFYLKIWPSHTDTGFTFNSQMPASLHWYGYEITSTIMRLFTLYELVLAWLLYCRSRSNILNVNIKDQMQFEKSVKKKLEVLFQIILIVLFAKQLVQILMYISAELCGFNQRIIIITSKNIFLPSSLYNASLRFIKMPFVFHSRWWCIN